MATLRIPFPESETPAVVILRGPRITLGRALDNTIQMRDRTVSAHHAELIAEGDHYRLHDLGATNGVLVDGQPVTDFHLREECKIVFGGVECQFSLEMPAGTSADPSLELVTRAECEALARDKRELAQQVATLREQVGLLERTHATGSGGATVPQVEFDRVVADLTAVKETLAERDRQIARLVASRGILQRDRDNLQRAVDEAAGAPVRIEVPAQVAAPAPVAAPPVAPSMPLPKPKPAFVPAAAGTKPAVPSSPQLPKPPTRLQPTPGTPVPMGKLVPVLAGPKGTQRIKV
jgi:predicted component of type VI protein secretion system